MMHKLFNFVLAVLTVTFAMFCVKLARATIAYSVSPLTIVAKQTDKVLETKITNNSSSDMTLQIQIKKWQQNGDQNLYTKTDAFNLAPAMATIKPGDSQFFRIGVVNKNDTTIMQAYRMFIKQLPGKFSMSVDESMNKSKDIATVHLLLDTSIPVFIQPSVPLSESFKWEIFKTPKDNTSYTLSLVNSGNTILKVTHINAKSDKGINIIDTDVLTYVLPHNTYNWVVKTNTMPQNIISTVNGEQITTESQLHELHHDDSSSINK